MKVDANLKARPREQEPVAFSRCGSTLAKSVTEIPFDEDELDTPDNESEKDSS